MRMLRAACEQTRILARKTPRWVRRLRWGSLVGSAGMFVLAACLQGATGADPAPASRTAAMHPRMSLVTVAEKPSTRVLSVPTPEPSLQEELEALRRLFPEDWRAQEK